MAAKAHNTAQPCRALSAGHPRTGPVSRISRRYTMDFSNGKLSLTIIKTTQNGHIPEPETAFHLRES